METKERKTKERRFWYFCTWRNGPDKEFGAVFSHESPSAIEVAEGKGIQSWVSLHGPYRSEKGAERAKWRLHREWYGE